MRTSPELRARTSGSASGAASSCSTRPACSPKFDDPDVGLRLAFIGSVKDTILDIELIAARFLTIMNENYPERIKERYKLEFPPESEEFERLEMLARKRGMLISGGEPDTERAAVMLLDEYRAGKLGRITLD